MILQCKLLLVHMFSLKTQHMSALKRMVRYILGTLDFGLHLYPSSILVIVCILGTTLSLGRSAKQQPTLSQSSVEVKYCGVANVVF